jgi:phycobilisome core linker protein
MAVHRNWLWRSNIGLELPALLYLCHKNFLAYTGAISKMRMFKITACVPSQTRIRTQRELQNTYFTKLVPYDNWFKEQQRIMKMGGKIVKVELATGKPGANAGLS